MDHLHEKEGKVQVLLNPKHHDGHLHAEEGQDQVQLPPVKHVEVGEYQVRQFKSSSPTQSKTS